MSTAIGLQRASVERAAAGVLDDAVVEAYFPEQREGRDKILPARSTPRLFEDTVLVAGGVSRTRALHRSGPPSPGALSRSGGRGRTPPG